MKLQEIRRALNSKYSLTASRASYRDVKAVAIAVSRISQAPQPARRGRSERPADGEILVATHKPE